jgi:hypothetical protein
MCLPALTERLTRKPILLTLKELTWSQHARGRLLWHGFGKSIGEVMIVSNLKFFIMNQDKEKDIDQQSNPSFTKNDLLGKQEQSEPAEQAEQQSSRQEEEQKAGDEESEEKED